MPKLRRKSAAVALAVLGVAGLSLASASTLNVTSSSLQAGVTNLTDCQTAADGDIVVTFAAPTYAAGGYTVNGVTLSNVPAACSTKDVKVTVINASDASAAEVTGVLGATGTFTASFAPVAAGALKGAAVVISG